jgi:hypothetical protein
MEIVILIVERTVSKPVLVKVSIRTVKSLLCSLVRIITNSNNPYLGNIG